MDDPANDIQDDALTHFLTKVRFYAKIFKHRHYCGNWAIDTSGSGHVPFHFIGKGSAWVHVGEHEPQLLQAGDLLLLPRDVPHAVSNKRTPPPEDLINAPAECDTEETFTSILCGFYIFDSSAAQVMLDDLPDMVLLSDARNHPDTAGVGYIIDAMMAELGRSYPGRTGAISYLARLLLLNLLRGRFAEGASSGYLAALGDPKISRALLLIYSRYGEDWPLQRLARETGMSRTAFANRFHTLVGMPPAKYLTAWRMQEATTLLENTTQSIEQVAEQCGYQSVVAFRKAYKNATGMTPKQVRLQHSPSLMGKAARLLLRSPAKN